jgi:predicted kinase
MAPRIIIIGGIPGTGKTTLAELLSNELGVSLFNKDKLEAAIIRRGLAKKNTLNGVGYELLAELAEGEINQGRSVILDCIASATRVQEFWSNITSQDIKYIECICSSISLHKERIENRELNIQGWYEITWSDIQSIKETYQPFSENRLILDSVESLSMNLKKAIDYVR